jgi:hypothetical protein
VLLKIPLIHAASPYIPQHTLLLIWYSLLIINVYGDVCDFVLCLILGPNFIALYLPKLASDSYLSDLCVNFLISGGPGYCGQYSSLL